MQDTQYHFQHSVRAYIQTAGSDNFPVVSKNGDLDNAWGSRKITIYETGKSNTRVRYGGNISCLIE